MSLTDADHADIGTLLGCAMRPTQRPGRHSEYRRVLLRYRTELGFRSATNALLHGLGAQVLSDGDFGLILGVSRESPLAAKTSEVPNTSTSENRILLGLVLVGLVAYAYPSAAELDDDRVRLISARDFDTWLRELCEGLRSHDLAGEVIPEQGLDEAWRIYLGMPSVVHTERGRATGRLSPKCTRYWVHNALGWLTDQGLAREDGSAEGAWTLTERFRVHAREVALERAYSFVTELRRAEGQARHPEDDPS